MAAFYSKCINKLNLVGAFKSNVRSYFRFHISSTPKETPAEKIALIEAKIKKDKVKIPVKINTIQLSSSIRHQSIVTLPIKETVVTPKNCVLYFTNSDSEPKTVDKISSLYNDFGLDVIIIEHKPSHLFLPETGKSVVDDLISKLSGNNLPLNVGNFVVHSVASGAFFYSVLTTQLAATAGTFNMNRIKGQIFDGLILNNPTKTLMSYRSSLPKFFVIGKDVYEESATKFIENPPNINTLVFHTVDDVNCDGAYSLIEKWKKNYLDISVSCWSRSVNKENYLSHPKQYERAIETFLIKIGFI